MENKKKVEIQKQARKILDKFASALGNIKVEEHFVEREEDRREEKDGLECDNDFREIMFENAPVRDNDFIIAEKKKW